MTRSSPARRSQLLSSPDRGYVSSFLYETRNDESTHRDALAAAQAEHDRVREAAIRVYELHELKEETERIMQQERREKERLKVEAEIAEKERALQELKAKTIPKPPPPPPPEPEPTPSPQVQQPVRSEPKPAADESASAVAPKQEPSPFGKPQSNGGLFSSTPKPTQTPTLASPPTTTTAPKPSPFATQTPPAAPTPASTAKPSATSQASSDPVLQRYVQIHQELKKLRKDLTALSKTPGSPLKGQMGTYRREIRVAIGQLTTGKGANAQPVSHLRP